MGRLKLATRCGSSSLSLASSGSFEGCKSLQTCWGCLGHCQDDFPLRSTKHGRLRSPCIVPLGHGSLSDPLSLPLDGHDVIQPCTKPFLMRNVLMLNQVFWDLHKSNGWISFGKSIQREVYLEPPNSCIIHVLWHSCVQQ